MGRGTGRDRHRHRDMHRHRHRDAHRHRGRGRGRGQVVLRGQRRVFCSHLQLELYWNQGSGQVRA